MKATDVLLGIVAVFVPPLPVWIKRGLCTADSFINIALWGECEVSPMGNDY